MRTRNILLLLAVLSAACTPQGERVNLALRHPAYHSSAIDYNATAQLAVDGILQAETPCWIEIRGDNGVPLDKIEHNLVLDERPWTSVHAAGSDHQISLLTHGFREVVDKVSMSLSAQLAEGWKETSYTAELQCLYGDEWCPVRHFKGRFAGGSLTCIWDKGVNVEADGWRFTIEIPGAAGIDWQMWQFSRGGQALPMLTSEHFSSIWVPATGGQQWLAVDLGAVRSFDEVRLHWLRAPASGKVQAGRDSSSWRDLAAFRAEGMERIDTLQVKGRGRWVRVLIDPTTDGNPCVLTEIEVMGNAPVQKASTVEAPFVSGRKAQLYDGWELARLPQADDPSAWIPATIPGTVLVSYLENRMLPDPNYGDNQQYISDSYFLSPFVYRCRFARPEEWSDVSDDRLRLHFDGINWKADVSMNGQAIGRIEGAFTDASFDVTDLLKEENLLEVTVYPPAHPGATKANTQERCATNGGILGADNPTFHASIGWDWIPTIRGRNMGIWNDAWLERHGPVRILYPNVVTRFPAQETLPPQLDTTRAFITLSATLANESDAPVEAEWEGSYGDLPFRETVALAAGESREVSTQLTLENPRLWWPNGYGEPYLYPVKMQVGDSHDVYFWSGVRQLTYDATGENLRIWINGRRLVGRGGNWGFSDSNLRYPRYYAAMDMHRHENFNLVRNWVGMIGDEEFYVAADQSGILVWQDFWLANPADGPDPDDEALFMDNAENMMLRVRMHPCLLLWCGRNEGFPPATLDQALRELVQKDNPESYYISSSADGEVSGRGPYFRLPSETYWHLDETAWYKRESELFHSERGMPNFPNYESLIKMMPAAEAWPPSRLWGVHDFALESAQRGQTFIDAVNAYFGPSPDGETFAARAQWVNYDGYRAMFESRSKQRRGLLLWMSHPAWPSMAFCTYDWFFDGTASYYACRKACEPLHVQWNPAAKVVEVVNYSAGNRSGLRVDAQLCDAWGVLLSKHSLSLDAPEDSTIPCFDIPLLSGEDQPEVGLLRLQLYDGETLVSQNDYVLGRDPDNLQALNALPNAKVRMKVQKGWPGYVTLTNISEVPALMIHLVAREPDGSRICPTYWSDNYIHLMPGETRTLTYTLDNDDTPFERIDISGFNLE